MNQWVHHYFTEEELSEAHEMEHALSNISYNEVQLSKGESTIWTGHAVEIAFKVFNEEHYNRVEGVDFYWNNKRDPFDDVDFTFPNGVYVDVKSVSSHYIPRLNYGCNIKAKQWKKKLEKGNRVNVIVFGRFVFPDESYLLGWITKKEFSETKIFRKEGINLGPMTVSEDMWEVPISALHHFKNVC